MSYIWFYVDKIEMDFYGIVVVIINLDVFFKVVIEVYVDEIFWFVYYIIKDGFIYVC